MNLRVAGLQHHRTLTQRANDKIRATNSSSTDIEMGKTPSQVHTTLGSSPKSLVILADDRAPSVRFLRVIFSSPNRSGLEDASIQ